MVAGVGGSLDHLFRAKAADGVSVGAEKGEGSEAGASAGIGVRKVGARQVDRSGPNIGGVGGHLADGALDSEGPGLQIAIAEAPVDSGEVQGSELGSR